MWAKAAGLRVGVYYYTYAQTESYADRELEALTAVLAGKKLEYPVFVDMEAEGIAALGRARATQLALYALEKLRAAGWYPGLYTYSNFAKNRLDMAKLSAYPFLWRITRAALPIRALTRCGSIPAQGVYRVYRAMWTWTIRMWIFCRPFRREATMAMNLRYPGWRWCRCPA